MSRYNNRNNRPNKSIKNEAASEMTPTQEELLRQTRKSITVRQRDGSEQTTTVRDAIIQKYIQTAANGSPHALNQIAKRMDDAERVEAEMIKENIDEGILMRNYFQNQLEEFTENEKEQGVSEGKLKERVRDYYPHPDDIIIHDKGYRLTGPYDEKSLNQYHYIMRLRDANILQYVLDMRSEKKSNSERSYDTEDDITLLYGIYVSKDLLEQRSALMFANTYNNLLPERFKLTDRQLITKIMQEERYTKRELLRVCYQGWAELDINVPRGWLSPPLVEGCKRLMILIGLSNKATECGNTGNHLTNKMWMDVISEIVREVEQETV